MKVLLLATGFPPVVGGIERFALNIARGLQTAGCTVHVVTTVGRGSDLSAGIPVLRTPPVLNRKFLKLVPLVIAAIRLCRRERPDHVVAMAWTHEGLAAVVLRALFGLEFAVVAHGTEILRYRDRPIYGFAMRFVLRRALRVVANSRFTEALIVGCGVAADRVAVVNPPVDVVSGDPGDRDVRRVEHQFGLEGRLVLFTAARLVPRKGHAQVIQVLGRLKDRYPHLVYVMTGTGESRAQLAELASRLGVAHRVVFTGNVRHEDLQALFRRADLYVSPSIEIDGDIEGFGMALAEAGAHGVPVIAGRCGGVPDAIEDGRTGLLVTPGDLDELTRAIVSLVDDEPRRRALGQQARTRIFDELRIDRQGARVRDLLAAPTPRLRTSGVASAMRSL